MQKGEPRWWKRRASRVAFRCRALIIQTTEAHEEWPGRKRTRERYNDIAKRWPRRGVIWVLIFCLQMDRDSFLGEMHLGKSAIYCFFYIEIITIRAAGAVTLV